MSKAKRLMLNAVGYVIKKVDGSCKGHLRVFSIKAEIVILSKIKKTSETQPDFRVVTNDIEIGSVWAWKDEASNKEYRSLIIAAL